MYRGDCSGRNLAPDRRRTGDDLPDPGNFSRNDAHMRRCDHRVTPTRHITADSVDGYVFVPEHNARQRLYFNVLQRRALRFSEVSYLFLRKFDVGYCLIRQAGDNFLDLVV